MGEGDGNTLSLSAEVRHRSYQFVSIVFFRINICSLQRYNFAILLFSLPEPLGS